MERNITIIEPANLLQNLRASLAAFHREEDGMETVQTILLIFVGATILLGLSRVLMPKVTQNVTQKITSLFSFNAF